METLLHDLRYALRVLARQPALALTVIGLLAVAIAGNTAIFSIYNGLFLKPLPVPHSDRLVDIDEMAPKWNLEYTYVNYVDFHEWRKENRTFDEMAVWKAGTLTLSGRGEARRLEGLRVTHDLLDTIGFQPMLGRAFLEKEDAPGGERVALISDGFWRREFGGDPGALGQILQLDSQPYTIVGVLPPAANFPQESDVWVLLQKSPDDGSSWYLSGIGRLKEGVSIAQAREDLIRVHKNMIETRPVNETTTPRIQTLRSRWFGDVQVAASVLLGAVGVLLLIACVNVAGLMLARSSSRVKEMGIRTALGASRGRIVSQLLTESVLLAVGGVLAGIGLGYGFLKLFVALLPSDLPSWVVLTADWRFALFCVSITGVSAMLFGLAPAVQVSRVNVQRTLHDLNARTSETVGRRRSLNVLVAGEVALAVVLLVGAGLLLRAWQNVRSINPGFHAENVLTYSIELPESVYADGDARVRFFDEFAERQRALPGVLAIGASTNPPLMGHNGNFFEVEGAPKAAPDEQSPVILTRSALPGYFEAMGIEFVRGRGFLPEDGRTEGSRAIVVNETFAQRFWGDADPIGKRVRPSGADDKSWMTVVGVNRDVLHYGLDQPMRPGVYLPYQQLRTEYMTFVVKTAVDPTSLVAPIRAILREIDPDVPLAKPMTMTETVDRSLGSRVAYSSALVLFAAVALLMAVAGLYGVVSYMVTRRTREIGIRMAFGARSEQVVGMVLGSGMKLVAVGILIGAVGAVGAAQAMRGLLFGVGSFDILTYAAVAGSLALVALLATLLPARRAAAIQPMSALRSE